MLKKLSAAAALVVAIAFATVSIAHACSGLMAMNPAVQQSPMNNMGDSNSSPCSKEKGDICQSVRDSLLSVKPAISAAHNSQQTILPLQILVVSPIQLVSSPLVPVAGSVFHPVFKLP